MILLPLGIVLAGYTVTWYGWALLRGPGIGLPDLVFPSRISKVDTWLSTPMSKSAGYMDGMTNPKDPVSGDPLYPGNPQPFTNPAQNA